MWTVRKKRIEKGYRKKEGRKRLDEGKSPGKKKEKYMSTEIDGATQTVTPRKRVQDTMYSLASSHGV